MTMKFQGEQGDIINVKVESKVAWESYTQNLKIAPYSVTRLAKPGSRQNLVYLEEVEKSTGQDMGKTQNLQYKDLQWF